MDEQRHAPDSPAIPSRPEGAKGWIVPAVGGGLSAFTGGLLSPFLLWYAFVRLRNPAAFLGALAATVLLVLFVVSEDMSLLENVSFPLLWVGGTVSSFALLRAVETRKASPGADRALEEGSPPGPDNRALLKAARERGRLRTEARRILESNRVHAIELGIGRPDLGTGFDDGGLIDVNHSPAELLARLPGLTPENLRRLEEMREAGVVFSSAEELAAAVDVDPRRVPELAEYAVFL
ncbi:hypothetical protein SUDANB121_03484 [Nocardiopsis dassonvillei]|uniref:hypothetical protein n=1 Tax=Nocardiopsis dassonvillei TaxID=2014 RepID=UPI003F571BC1